MTTDEDTTDVAVNASAAAPLYEDLEDPDTMVLMTAGLCYIGAVPFTWSTRMDKGNVLRQAIAALRQQGHLLVTIRMDISPREVSIIIYCC